MRSLSSPRETSPRRWPLRFSLKWLFVAMFLSAGLWARLFPGPQPQRPLAVFHRYASKDLGQFDHYTIEYSDGTNETYLDDSPFGDVERVTLGHGYGEENEDGCYQSEEFHTRYRRGLRHEGLVRPGDEILCKARFEALLAELRGRIPDREVLSLDYPVQAPLPLDWPRLADLLRKAHGPSSASERPSRSTEPLRVARPEAVGLARTS